MTQPTSDLKKALHIVEKCGPWHGSKLISQAMWRRIYPPARRQRSQWQAQLRDDAAWDQAYNVDTCGDCWLSDSGVPMSESARGNGIYRPVGRDLFEHGMSKLSLDFQGFTFVDYGSGKGKALFLASIYRFKEILGIEYAPALHRIAQANLASFRNPHQQCQQIQPILADAMHYEPPADPLVCFFFNPFDDRTLEQVLNKISKSWQTFNRPIWLVYVNRRNIKESLHVFKSAPKLQVRYTDQHAGIFEFSDQP